MDKDFRAIIKKLYQWQHSQRDENDFTHQLFSSFQKANENEFSKLERSFPQEAKAYKLWYSSKDSVRFFESYGVPKRQS